MNKAIVSGGVAGLLLVGALSLVSFQSNAAETVIIRGIVQSVDAKTINMSYTFIGTAADKTKWQGLNCDVDVGTATRYVWNEKSGSLLKTKTSAIPTAGKEVVFKGTLQDDCRGKASWVVTNYREYEMTGTLEGITLDTGSTDAGNMTVNVKKLIMRDVVPERKFKESQFKGVDIIIRFNGLTAFTALGKAKQADEVTAGQQTVVIEGEMISERFVASKVNEK